MSLASSYMAHLLVGMSDHDGHAEAVVLVLVHHVGSEQFGGGCHADWLAVTQFTQLALLGQHVQSAAPPAIVPSSVSAMGMILRTFPDPAHHRIYIYIYAPPCTLNKHTTVYTELTLY